MKSVCTLVISSFQTPSSWKTECVTTDTFTNYTQIFTAETGDGIPGGFLILSPIVAVQEAGVVIPWGRWRIVVPVPQAVLIRDRRSVEAS